MDYSRDNAARLAGELFIRNILRILSTLHYVMKDLTNACLPLLSIDWNRSTLTSIGWKRLSELMRRLRLSRLDRVTYRTILSAIKISDNDESVIFPFDLEMWRRIIVRFNLNQITSFPEWLVLIRVLDGNLITSPESLTNLSLPQLRDLFETDPNFKSILQLWQASHIFIHPSSTTTGSTLNFSANAGLLAQSLRHKDISLTIYAKQHTSTSANLELPDNFETLGPAAKINELARSSASSSDILAFLNNGVTLNIVRQCKDSLPSVASGIQCYSAFCDLIGAPYFPPTNANVKRWGSLFNPGKTFGLYVNHLAKACQILDIATDWYGNSVRAIARGLFNVQDLSAKFDNFIFKEIFAALIRHEGLDTEIGRLFYVSFVFLLRVQSEGLPMKRASSIDRLSDKSPTNDQSLIAIRDVAGEDRLILKLRTRKNIRHNSIIMRPCFCNGSVIATRGLCPVHDFWPAVRRATDIGSYLFASIRRKNLNRILKASLTSIEVTDAHRYSLRGFRRGCIMEIKRSGSTLGVILGTGGWAAAGYKSYLSFQEDEEAVLKALLNEIDNGFGSEDDYSSSGDDDCILGGKIARRNSA